MKKVIVFILVALMALTYSFATTTATSDATSAGGASVDATIDLEILESDVSGYRIGISSTTPGVNFDSPTHSMDTGVPAAIDNNSIALTYSSSKGTASGTAYFYYKVKGATNLTFDVTGPAMTPKAGQGKNAPAYLAYTINDQTATDDKDTVFYVDQPINLETDGFDAGYVSLDVETEPILPIHIGTWQAKLTVTVTSV